MKDILSTRLNMIENNLESIRNFANLDNRRLTDLENLKTLLDTRIKLNAREIDRNITDLHDSLTDLKRAIKDPEVIESCTKIQATSQNVKNESIELKKNIDEALNTAFTIMKPRIEVEKTDLSKIAVKNFSDNIDEIGDWINKVRDDIEKIETNNPNEAVQHWKAAWQDYWDHIHKPSLLLIGEYVDFMRGLATRDCKLDDEICQLADDLISKWKVQGVSLTIPVKYVALESAVARIVRLSYQDWTTWALPVVACEVSYVIHSKENAGEKINNYIKQQVEAGASETHLRDYLADIFATYGMGPAYCYSMIYLRFNPLHTNRANGHHAPDTWRAETIFKMLDWMSTKKMKDNPYQGILQKLREDWQEVLTQAGQPEQLSQQNEEQIKTWVDEFAKLIYDNDNQGLMYPAAQWDRAIELSEAFNDNKMFSRVSKTSDDLRAILNAAWLVRAHMQNGEISIEDIEIETKNTMAVISGRMPPRVSPEKKQPAYI